MLTRSVIAIFGYNNTRIYDVQKIKSIVEQDFNAQVLLIKEGITLEDFAVTPFCFDHRPEDSEIGPLLEKYLLKENLKLLGCLPFSDKGVIGAAFTAEYFGLFGDDPKTALAMLDKSLFRKHESLIEIPLESYKKPFFFIAKNETDLFSILKNFGPYFAKPTSEGNSRGCMKIETSEDIKSWVHDNLASLEKGVICEEILSQNNEYSFDGVAGHYWLTEKFTTEGAYKAEYQQIVPAPFSNEATLKLTETLTELIQCLGSQGGAFHHEFFAYADGRIASVEPNRRPAGMWIWDLASLAFPDLNPWKLWISRCTRLEKMDFKLKSLPKREFFAGVRGVISKKSGLISQVDESSMLNDLLKTFGDGNFRLSILKFENDPVKKIPRDNSDFLAYVSLRNKNYDSLVADLATAESIILNYIKVQS